MNARADVLAALLGAFPGALSLADLARQTRFTKPNIASAVDALLLAGLLTARTAGNERRIVLASNGAVLPGLRPPVAQPDWVARFGVALAVLRFTERDRMSTTVRAIEARRMVDTITGRISAEGIPKPDLDVLGDAFAAAFDRWLGEFVAWLARPPTAGSRGG